MILDLGPWGTPSRLLGAAAVWAIQQTFLTSAIVGYKAHRHRTDLVLAHVMSEEDGQQTGIERFASSIMTVAVAVTLVVILAQSITLALIDVLLLTLCTYLITRLPWTAFKQIKSTLRFPWIVYKNTIYNLLTPTATLILAVICLAVTYIVR